MAQSSGMQLLIVEDDPDFRDTCGRWMTRKGHQTEMAANASAALELCERRAFDVAIVDINMPGMNGLELLERMKSANMETEVLMLTGQGSIESAVNAMKLGASDYLTKPFPLDELEQRCLMAWNRARLQRENRQLKAIIERSSPSTKITGQSAAMQEVLRLIARVAPTDKPVLIQGESGTGKELIARTLQQQSQRARKPFVTINCAALPEQLVESELFGYRKGAFTGAAEDRAGLFEVADGGTLFIDEIGELPGSLQPKLLRALEDGSIRRVGSTREQRVDVRLIAATNRRLADEVAAGRFREDLYYRINVMSLELPPLRQRTGDIELLIREFLPANWVIQPDAVQALVAYHWPGNIRQLKNVIERGVIMADDQTITRHELPAEIRGELRGSAAVSCQITGKPEPLLSMQATAGVDSPMTESYSEKLDDLQRAHVLEVLRRNNGNKSRAANLLGIHRRKLYRLLERYGEAR